MADTDLSQEELRQENQRLTSLVELSRNLAGVRDDLGQKLQNCVEVLARLTRAEKVSLMLLEDDGLVVRAATNPDLIGLRTPMDEYSISTEVVSSKAPVFTKSVQKSDYQGVSRQGDMSSYRTGSLISLPLLEKNLVVGVLNLSDKQAAPHFDQKDLDTAQGIVEQLASQVNFSALHSRLNQAYHDLEASQRAKDDLMYMVFHDMKAPITGVKEILKLLDDPAACDTMEPGQLLDLAQGDLEMLWRRISNLLDLNRMEGGVFPLNPVQLDMAALARETADRLVGICRLNQVELNLEELESPGLRQDEDLVERVLVNLLVNAIKASSPEQGGGGKVSLSVDTDNKSVLVIVSDTGCGVDPELGHDIFERFVQGERSKGSSGIGLYFCRQAARLMGGEVSYINRGKGGAVFKLRLPLMQGS